MEILLTSSVLLLLIPLLIVGWAIVLLPIVVLIIPILGLIMFTCWVSGKCCLSCLKKMIFHSRRLHWLRPQGGKGSLEHPGGKSVFFRQEKSKINSEKAS